jgi:ATP-independent RNA helicase DbpA
VLVATDVAARGLDVAQLEAVINVDVTSESGVTSTLITST